MRSRTAAHIALFVAGLGLTLAGLALLQENILTPNKVRLFPDTGAYMPTVPRWAANLPFVAPPAPPANEPAKKKSSLYAGRGDRFIRRFFSRLERCEKKKNTVVRVLHFGDSLIWADFVTSGFRYRFIKDFGDGGRGLVPIISKAERMIWDHSNMTPWGQVDWRIAQAWGSPDPVLGFLGETAFPVGGTVTMPHRLPDDPRFSPWSKVTLYYRPPADGATPFTVKLVHDGGTIAETVRPRPGRPCSLVEYAVPRSRAVTITLGDLPARRFHLDALNFETPYGVAYSSVSRQGIEMVDLLTVSEESFSCGMKQYAPDLVVFQYGVNESQNMWLSNHTPPSVFKKGLEDVIDRFRKHLPETDMLILSPVERIRRNKQGVMDTMPEILIIRDVMKEVCARKGVAFYDSFEALGGRGHNRLLYEKKLMQDDRTHLTREGGDYFAGVVYADIHDRYLAHFGRRSGGGTEQGASLAEGPPPGISFNSPSYAVFLAAVFVLCALVARRPSLRLGVLAVASLFFYATWNFAFTALLLAVAVLDYSCALAMGRARAAGKSTAGWYVAGVAANLGALFFFKYYAFAAGLLQGLAGGAGFRLPAVAVALPVGISFYTFQALSYLTDVRRGEMNPEPSALRFTQYLAFFPQILSGPITRAVPYLARLQGGGSHFTIDGRIFATGCFMIMAGLLKKTGADWIGANLVDRVYKTPELYTGIETIAAWYAYALQIYCDFSGYSDIAIGSARILGFRLADNFDHPYASASATEFWRRWHITLGGWFRDYLYIGLGGNRRWAYRNLFLTMALCGLWHGAGAAFVLWGMYHGALMVFERATGLHRAPRGRVSRAVRTFVTLHLVIAGWVLFRCGSVETLKALVANIAQWKPAAPNLDAVMIAVLAAGYAYSTLLYPLRSVAERAWDKTPSLVRGSAFALAIAVVYNIATAEAKPFIYFQF